MSRIIIAGVLGAIVYYIWGMLAWMAIPLHTPTIAALADETTITTALKKQNLAAGVYQYPWIDNEGDGNNADSDFTKKHQAGPIFTIYYHPAGATPMNARVLAGGFVINLFAATLAACLLSSVSIDAGRSYARRVGFVIGLGIFVALIGHVSYWNWMLFPTDYTVAFVIDVVIGWTLAGLAIAAVVRPRETVHSAVADQRRSQPQPKSPPKSKPGPAPPVRNDAITLLATLQREARFVDIVKEPLGEYSDAQVGAAARDVLRDCGLVLDRLFELQPIVVDKEEGAETDLPAGFDTGRYRVTGNVTGEAPYSGPLVHHGWEAKRCALPQWSGSKDAALVVTPAELEVK